jgi:hypothetical protein
MPRFKVSLSFAFISSLIKMQDRYLKVAAEGDRFSSVLFPSNEKERS